MIYKMNRKHNDNSDSVFNIADVSNNDFSVDKSEIEDVKLYMYKPRSVMKITKIIEGENLIWEGDNLILDSEEIVWQGENPYKDTIFVLHGLNDHKMVLFNKHNRDHYFAKINGCWKPVNYLLLISVSDKKLLTEDNQPIVRTDETKIRFCLVCAFEKEPTEELYRVDYHDTFDKIKYELDKIFDPNGACEWFVFGTFSEEKIQELQKTGILYEYIGGEASYCTRENFKIITIQLKNILSCFESLESRYKNYKFDYEHEGYEPIKRKTKDEALAEHKAEYIRFLRCCDNVNTKLREYVVLST